jgi:uncharacterized membrane protein
MIAGMMLMNHSISIKIDENQIYVGIELFIMILFGFPVFISMTTESFPHLLVAFIIAILPVVTHLLIFVDKSKVTKKPSDDKKPKKEKKSSSSSED